MSKDLIQEQLNKILEFVSIDPEIRIEENEGSYQIDIRGDDLNFLIGYHGEALDSLQNILGHSIYKQLNEWIPLSIDINDYKKAKLEKLEEMVKSIIDRVRFHRKEMKLPLLNPYERRHVHTFVSEYLDVKSESRGEGRERRLFLVPADSDNTTD